MDPSSQAPIEALPLDATLQVHTPERVQLGLPVAGVGTRALAWTIDAALLFFAWVTLFFLVSLTQVDLIGAYASLSGLGTTLLLVGAFAAQWLYWTLSEVLWGGRTAGKALMRIRVARLDGSTPGPLESAVRNLLRVVDFLPLGYCVGLLTALFNDQHRRLGDLAAGTLLLREEQISLDHYRVTQSPASLPTAEAPLQVTGPAAALLRDFLAREPGFTPEARARLARRFLERLGGDLAPERRAALEADPAALRAWLRSLQPLTPFEARPLG